MVSKKKVFVLDTNVLLHDFKCLHNFQDNDIVIPIPVLEELDKFKKGFDQINFNARQVARDLSTIIGDNDFSNGVTLGDGLGKLYVETNRGISEKVKANFPEHSADHTILSIVDDIRHKRKEPVIFVSKDINLRIKAKSLGIVAQDYETDKVTDMNIFTTAEMIKNISPTFVNNMFQSREPVSAKDIPFSKMPDENKHLVLCTDDQQQTIPVYFELETQTLHPVLRQHAYGIEPRNIEQKFALQALLNPKVPLVSITGKAGTGKTLLALAAALEQSNEFDHILLARPVIPLSNRDIGFLPGDVKDKIGPYMLPLFDNLNVIKSINKKQSRLSDKIDQMLKDERLIITPLAYIRGRSLNNVFFIVDEAQNLTPHEIKTIITRAGENAKIVFTGDIQQIDTPYLDARSNGLSYLTERVRKQPLFMHVHLQKGERSKLAEMASNML